ncbi:hypothetical protein SNEBB_006865 [Seison nebaliae]|nr:hypothetical protein SNEBB_006865 [Seison nebaliae]
MNSQSLYATITPIGDVIEGTRIIPIKTPITETNFSPEICIDELRKRKFQIKTIINLTNEKRYYKDKDFEKFNINVIRLPVRGCGRIPSDELVDTFIEIIDKFHKDNPDTYVLIHCLHGLNRTGYFICRYLIKNHQMRPFEAIEKFNRNRHHEIRYRSLVDDLLRRQPTLTFKEFLIK